MSRRDARPAAALLLAGALLASAAPAIAQAPAGQTPAPQNAVTGDGAFHRDPNRPPPSPEMVAARQAARQACAADVAKLCADAQSTAGGGGAMRCMREHRSEVSPACSDAMSAVRDARRAAAKG